MRTHLPFHEAYLRDMRKKANAVIDAWFSPNSQPVETLYRRFGITHFVVDKKARANPQLCTSSLSSNRLRRGVGNWAVTGDGSMRRRRTVSFAAVLLVEAHRSDVLS